MKAELVLKMKAIASRDNPTHRDIGQIVFHHHQRRKSFSPPPKSLHYGKSVGWVPGCVDVAQRVTEGAQSQAVIHRQVSREALP